MNHTETNYNPWQAGGFPLLNIAATCFATKAHGPGLRAAIWVQGCLFHCPGCISPSWIPYQIEMLRTPEQLATELLAEEELSGVTFSGGEPMLQAAGLAQLIRLVRKERAVSLICFTGYGIEQIRTNPPGKGVADLLAEVDVLIDGPYIAERNDDKGLRGSDNQRVWYLTNRISPADYDFINSPRQAEIHIRDGETLLVGVPPKGLLETFDQAIESVTKQRAAFTETILTK